MKSFPHWKTPAESDTWSDFKRRGADIIEIGVPWYFLTRSRQTDRYDLSPDTVIWLPWKKWHELEKKKKRSSLLFEFQTKLYFYLIGFFGQKIHLSRGYDGYLKIRSFSLAWKNSASNAKEVADWIGWSLITDCQQYLEEYKKPSLDRVGSKLRSDWLSRRPAEKRIRGNRW